MIGVGGVNLGVRGPTGEETGGATARPAAIARAISRGSALSAAMTDVPLIMLMIALGAGAGGAVGRNPDNDKVIMNDAKLARHALTGSKLFFFGDTRQGASSGVGRLIIPSGRLTVGLNRRSGLVLVEKGRPP